MYNRGALPVNSTVMHDFVPFIGTHCMSRTDPQFNLRIPQELRDRVVEAAQANKRSVTAEILARLEESFAASPAPQPLAAKDDGLRVLNSDGTVTTYTDDKIVRALVKALESVEGRTLRELLRERGADGEGAGEE